MAQMKAVLLFTVLFGLAALASADDVVTLGAGQCTAVKCQDKMGDGKPGSEGFFQEFAKIHGFIKTEQVNYTRGCCHLCRMTPGCVYWQHYRRDSLCEAGPCHLMGSTGVVYRLGKGKMSRIGGKCNAKVEDDPHFTGARGTRFDFNGEPDNAFCLVSDKNLHINMMLRGYYDNRTTGATLIKNGKAVRTWIKEIGLIWNAEGAQHNVHLTARNGKQQERGDGFLASAVVDGRAMPLLRAGEKFTSEGGLVMEYVGVATKGPYEMDHYVLTIGDLVSLDINMRVAHPMLQSEDDAEVHFNIAFNNIKPTSEIHGVLGQTFRADREQRAIDYSDMGMLLHAPIQADGESGRGFLDGNAAIDYISSDVLSTDCSYNQFEAPGAGKMSILDFA
eukprot:jgi/Mesen1/4947/ME000247S04225